MASRSKPQSRSGPDIQAAMEAVLAAERAAMDAIASSQQRAEELLQDARVRARRIAEHANRRVAALERAAGQGAPFRGVAGSSREPLRLKAEEQARLEKALQRLADQLLGGDDDVA